MTQYMLSVHHDPVDDARMAAMTPDEMQATFEAVDAVNNEMMATDTEVHGAATALRLVDQLDLDAYPLFHATRADLLVRLDRPDEAATAYDRALELVGNEAERRFLQDRRASLG